MNGDRAARLHAGVLSVIEDLMKNDPEPDTQAGQALIALATAVEEYEKSVASEREEIVLLRRACDAAFAFIEAHVADPDITDEMRRKYADYKDAREALEGR